MKARDDFELPAELQAVHHRAIRLEWATIGFLASIVLVIYLTMGGSQAMKAAWIEDMLSFVAPVAFLVSARFRHRRANDRFPYGYHRSVSIAFLAGAVALTLFGAFILYDSVMGLARREHPTIGTMVLFGHQVWAGWVMMAALLYSAIPPLVLGRMKTRPARQLHDKTLMADADMNRADWLTAGAAMVGIAGIGVGWWWADSAAGALISIDITSDGVKNLKRVVADLMDRRPVTVDGEPSDVPARVREALAALPWVVEAEVRMREEGHVFAGEVFLTARGGGDLAGRVAEARRVARGVDWRVLDVVVEIVEAGA